MAALLGTLLASLVGAVPTPGAGRRDVVTVGEVVDGDTIAVHDESGVRTIRLLAVDAPETRHPARGVECFGPEASAFLRTWLTGRVVALEFDVERRDRYGRELAYVYLGNRRVNDELVRRGLARYLVIPPNVRHARTILAAELRARAERRGIWSACSQMSS